MHVCYVGYYNPDYPRNAVLRRGLATNGVDVTEIRIPPGLAPSHSSPSPDIPRSPGDRVAYELHELRKTARRLARVIQGTQKIISTVDAVVVAEFSQGLVAPVAAVGRRYGKPVVVDLLISLFDEAVNHRKTLSPRRPRAVSRWLLDAAAIRLADVVLVDTAAQADYLEGEFGGLRGKERVVELGAPEWQFTRAPLRNRTEEDRLTVLFYGHSQPLQGVRYIVEAANRVRSDRRFEFKIVGPKPDFDLTDGSQEIIEWLPPVSAAELQAHIAASDVCLGVFGECSVAGRVVPNKVWQCMSVGRPVITRDGPGPRSLLHDGYDCLLVPPADPDAIVSALKRLATDSRLATMLSIQASELVHANYGSVALGRKLLSILTEVTA